MKKAHNKAKTFLHVFRHSLIPYDNYYHDIRKKASLIFSLKYITVLITLVTLAHISVGVFIFLRAYNPDKLKEQIPSDYIVTLTEQGRLTTNYDRPLILFNAEKANDHTALAVIDPKAYPDQIYEYDTYILFTEKKIVTNFNDSVSTFEYSNNNEMKLQPKNMFIPGSESYKLIGLAIMAFILYIATAPIFALIFRLIYLAIISLFVFIIARLFIQKLTLKKTFGISLHAATAPILFEGLLFILNMRINYGGLWFLLLTIVFLIAALYEAYIEPDTRKKKA